MGCSALQQTFVDHPWLHITFLVLLLVFSGYSLGFSHGLALGDTLRSWRRALGQRISLWLASR